MTSSYLALVESLSMPKLKKPICYKYHSMIIFFMLMRTRKKKWDVNVTYLWYCQLGHISESKINKLHKEEFFDLYIFESYETCKSYLMGKMIKILFTGHEIERANCYLIHINIWRLITTQVRDEYSIWDMVWSIIYFTDLLTSFLGYALETAVIFWIRFHQNLLLALHIRYGATSLI